MQLLAHRRSGKLTAVAESIKTTLLQKPEGSLLLAGADLKMAQRIKNMLGELGVKVEFKPEYLQPEQKPIYATIGQEDVLTGWEPKEPKKLIGYTFKIETP